MVDQGTSLPLKMQWWEWGDKQTVTRSRCTEPERCVNSVSWAHMMPAVLAESKLHPIWDETKLDHRAEQLCLESVLQLLLKDTTSKKAALARYLPL